MLDLLPGPQERGVLGLVRPRHPEGALLFSSGAPVGYGPLPDGTIPHEEWVQKAGYALSPNGKTNLGMGRPLFREDKP